jgi:hypothetical protein
MFKKSISYLMVFATLSSTSSFATDLREETANAGLGSRIISGVSRFVKSNLNTIDTLVEKTIVAGCTVGGIAFGRFFAKQIFNDVVMSPIPQRPAVSLSQVDEMFEQGRTTHNLTLQLQALEYKGAHLMNSPLVVLSKLAVFLGTPVWGSTLIGASGYLGFLTGKEIVNKKRRFFGQA